MRVELVGAVPGQHRSLAAQVAVLAHRERERERQRIAEVRRRQAARFDRVLGLERHAVLVVERVDRCGQVLHQRRVARDRRAQRQPLAHLEPHLGALVDVARFARPATEVHLGDLVAHLAQLVDHARAVAGIDEHRIGLEVHDGLAHVGGQRHVVDLGVHPETLGQQALAHGDHAAVITKARRVHAQDHGCEVVLVATQMAPCGLLHVRQADELLIARGAEVAQVLALPAHLAHLGLQARHLARWQRVGVVHGVERAVPVGLGARGVEELREQVHALGRADEERPAVAVGQRRLQHVVPHLGLDLRHLVDDHTVQAHAAHRVGVVSAVAADHGAVVGHAHPELGLVDLAQAVHHERLDLLLQARPGDGLGLLEQRCDVEEQPEVLREAQRLVDELGERELGLAGPAVQRQHREALAVAVAVLLPGAGPVAQVDDLGHTSSSASGRTCGTPVLTTICVLSGPPSAPVISVFLLSR